MKQQEVFLGHDELVDDAPIKETIVLRELYERSSVAALKHARYEKAKGDTKWIEAMKKELSMIEKNNTLKLVEKPTNKKVIRVRSFQNQIEPRWLYEQAQG